ncbi:Hypothetical predicted protein, partial [Pelobates cultripes]
DRDIIQEDLNEVTTDVRVTAEKVSTMAQHQVSNTEQIVQLQAAQSDMQVRRHYGPCVRMHKSQQKG